MLIERRCELPEQFGQLAEDPSAEKSIHPQNRTGGRQVLRFTRCAYSSDGLSGDANGWLRE
jgi:hypothetical protein